MLGASSAVVSSRFAEISSVREGPVDLRPEEGGFGGFDRRGGVRMRISEWFWRRGVGIVDFGGRRRNLCDLFVVHLLSLFERF